MENRPGTVVVETSVNPYHGSRTGQVLTIDDRAADDITNVFQQFGRMLTLERDPVHGEVWQVLPKLSNKQALDIPVFLEKVFLVNGQIVQFVLRVFLADDALRQLTGSQSRPSAVNDDRH